LCFGGPENSFGHGSAPVVRTYTAAVAGCGRMGAFTSPGVRRHAPPCWFPLAHAEAIKAHDRLRLSAMADLDLQSVRRAGDVYGCTSIFTDPIRMILEACPKLLSIATRTVGRAELIQVAARAGVLAMHVEKPLCNSVAELRQLRELFDGDELFLTIGTIRRYMPPYQTAIALAHSGKFGDLNEVEVNFGRQSLFWAHPHSVDMILQAAGDQSIESVSADLSGVVQSSDGRSIESDPIVESAVITFSGGLKGRITRHYGNDFILHCEKGRIVVDADGRECFVLASENEDPYPIRRSIEFNGNQWGGTAAPINHLVQCLDGDDLARERNKRLRKSIFLMQETLFAMVISNERNGCPVKLADITPSLAVYAKTGGRPA
jgi:scyllo-inositol 2-dehydrogenase (NAD+)